MFSQKKDALWRSVLLTSLPAYIVAEIFFASVYYVIVQLTRGIYILGSSFSTAVVEANMQIFGVFNVSISIVSILLISVVTCIEIATIISITLYDYYRNDHIPLRSLLYFSYKNIRSLFSWKVAPLFILVLFFPKEHIGPQGVLSLNIPDFITQEILKNPYLLPFLLGTLIVFGYFLYRSLFFIHAMLFERAGVLLALKKSFSLTQRIGALHMLYTVLRTLFWIILISGPLFLLVFSLENFFIFSRTYIGVFGAIFAAMSAWFLEFMMIGLPSIIFLASLTITYIQYTKLDISMLQEYFPFLSQSRVHVPRWHNLRTLFQEKGRLVLFLGTVTACIFVAVLNIRILYQSHLQSVEIIAHRGDTHGNQNIIENTVESIENAVYHGATLVEIDVYENRDGTLILSHDSNIRRISGINKNIADLSDTDLSQIRLSNGVPIPTLESVLFLAREKNIHLLIEPKLHGQEKRLYDTLIELIEKTQTQALVSIHSLNLDSLLEIKKRAPNLPVGYIVFGGIGDFGALPVDFFSIEENLLTQSLIQQIHNYQKKIYAWTMNNPNTAEQSIYDGVDGIITDVPDDIKQRYIKMKGDIGYRPRQMLSFFGFTLDISPSSYE